ncbi:MAG: cytochrome c oxidase subunit II [Gammaproteobacteria bacterium]
MASGDPILQKLGPLVHHHRAPLAWVVALPLAGCAGSQSALAPAGLEAAWIAQLFWVMLIGAGLIWALVIGFAVYVTRISPEAHSEKAAGRLIVWGGVVFPVTVLGALLIYGLMLMPALRAAGDGLRVHVSGEQWWWRVNYHAPGRDAPVTSANEIRLPVGQRVEIRLVSPDVIHSFWIPSLAGKVDMIPGRTTRLVLEPTRTGVYRGQCAEYCGTSHALMAFSVAVMPRDAFAAWLEKEARPAARPRAPRSEKGRNLFLATGCGACHRVRGTQARGVIGPDLTHVGGRRTIGAGMLSNNAKSIARFIAQTQRIKPGVRMPSFGMLPDDDIEAIAAYLESLE